MALISKEYEKFLREQVRPKQSLYERLCNFAEKVLPIPPWEGLQESYRESIAFAHLQATPKGAFSLVILVTLLVLLLPLSLAVVFDTLSLGVIILILVFTAMMLYYLYDYPSHYAIVFRIKASAEMVLTIVYMTIAMRIAPNIENAVKFAAENLTGPLVYDLNELMWSVMMRKYDSMSEGLDSFIEKWKKDNEEFTKAIYLIKTSSFESTAKRERMLDEAVAVALNGTKQRMGQYARDLRTPLTVLNAMGILLPIIGLVFFPMIAIFMPQVVQPVFIAVGYCVLLPLAVYWMMNSSLEKRPYTLHNPDVSKHPQFAKEIWLNKSMLLSIAASAAVIVFSFYKIISIKEQFSFDLLLYSLLITAGIGSGIAIYCLLSTYKKIKLREEIISVESEFIEALFQLANQITRGIPIESALKQTMPSIKHLKISKMFEKILNNIETFGMTLEQAVFDKELGVIRLYPSDLIRAILHATVEISKKGMSVVSKAMLSISTYLKDMRSVEDELESLLSETVSTMQIQALMLAPVSSGIVVALAGIMMHMMIALKGVIESIERQMTSAAPMEAVGGGLFMSIINVNKMIPVHVFQLIVGIYMIEVVGLIAVFLSIIKNGEENLIKRYDLGTMLLLAVIIYSVTTVFIYTIFTSIMPIIGLMQT